MLGTNFYMMTKNKELAEKYFPREYELVDSPYFGYEIHIGKRSLGWKPLLQAHKNAYKSVKELTKFLEEHKEFEIFDEYESWFTLEGLQLELLDWEKHQEVQYMKYIPEGVIVDEKYGWKKFFIESTEDDYDIKMPFDHLEYGNKFSIRPPWHQPKCFHDEDGYDFIEGDFS